jgi:hypothetical protein
MRTVVSADTPRENFTTTSHLVARLGALRSKTCVSQQDMGSRLSSPNLSFKTEVHEHALEFNPSKLEVE